jgi:hypothetical protein
MVGLMLLAGCQGSPAEESFSLPPAALDQAMQDLTLVMVDDIFSPPLAGRTYAYAGLAAWEAYALLSPQESLKDRIQGYGGMDDFENAQSGSGAGAGSGAGSQVGSEVFSEADAALTAVLAYYGMVRELVFSEDQVVDAEEAFRTKYQTHYTSEQWDQSTALARQVVQALHPFRDSDGYAATRSLPRYPLHHQEGYWRPTAPGYMDAIEPNWSRLRPFSLDSAAQFKPVAPVPYSTDPSSRFYADMLEVYEIGKTYTDEQALIASFWDCNPFFLAVQGHFNYSSKKISPGAHWMGIAATACRNAGLDFEHTLWVQTILGLTLHDAFISCWDEKYRSEYIRPETVINALLDPEWKPLLQTPPFPEYTSGHSVVSNASATVLTRMLGAQPFTDSVEVPYGLPARHFASFEQAAAEATISRMYGGIHFRPAVEVGATQGQQVGQWIADYLNLQPVVTGQ